MNIRILSSVVLASLVTVAAAQAECIYPKAPANLPDGATAAEADMVDGMKKIKAYNAEVTAYLSCLDLQMQSDITAAGSEAPPEQVEQIKAINAKRHNAAVEELESHANRFNEQVKTFKARSKKS